FVDPFLAHVNQNPLDATPSPSIAPAQLRHRAPTAEQLVNHPLIVAAEGAPMVREERQRRILGLRILERVTKRGAAPAQHARQLPRDFREARAAIGQLPGALNHFALLVFTHLTEPLAAPDPLTIIGRKPLDGAVQKTDPTPVAEQEFTPDQPGITPT